MFAPAARAQTAAKNSVRRRGRPAGAGGAQGGSSALHRAGSRKLAHGGLLLPILEMDSRSAQAEAIGST
jgi:hypothetical protein